MASLDLADEKTRALCFEPHFQGIHSWLDNVCEDYERNISLYRTTEGFFFTDGTTTSSSMRTIHEAWSNFIYWRNRFDETVRWSRFPANLISLSNNLFPYVQD